MYGKQGGTPAEREHAKKNVKRVALREEEWSARKIALSLGMSRVTVTLYLKELGIKREWDRVNQRVISS